MGAGPVQTVQTAVEAQNKIPLVINKGFLNRKSRRGVRGRAGPGAANRKKLARPAGPQMNFPFAPVGRKKKNEEETILL